MPVLLGPAVRYVRPGPPVFLQLLILNSFKSKVLEVLIPESLQLYFWKCGFQRG
jgi:hypothetical protein